VTVALPRRRRALVALAVGGTALSLAACNHAPAAAPTATTPPAVTQHTTINPSKAAPPTPAVPPTWPLTGVAASEAPSRPALTVKIENSVDARPQTGLEQADMVWEEVVEGGITRFAAVFESQVPSEVGPVRSVRPMDPVIAGPTKGLIAFSGGQAGFVAKVRASPLQLFSQDSGSPGFYRKSGVAPAPHNLYGTPSVWWAHADSGHSAPPPRQFEFARSADQATALTGAPATTIAVTMSGGEHPNWSWDAASGTWQRSEGSKPAVSRSGQRLQFTNVVTLGVRLVDTGTKDPAGNPVPETVLAGSGSGTVSSGGHTIPVTWSKGSDSEPVVLTTADGKPVLLAPGTTWVELVPGGSGGVQAS
jgi:hypothetical protein